MMIEFELISSQKGGGRKEKRMKGGESVRSEESKQKKIVSRSFGL